MATSPPGAAPSSSDADSRTQRRPVLAFTSAGVFSISWVMVLVTTFTVMSAGSHALVSMALTILWGLMGLVACPVVIVLALVARARRERYSTLINACLYGALVTAGLIALVGAFYFFANRAV